MITSINEILTEWAFRTSDGLPNPKSMAHQILLEGILKNYGWSMEARAELLNNLMEAREKKPKGWFVNDNDKVVYRTVDYAKKKDWAPASDDQIQKAEKEAEKEKVYTDKDNDGDVDKIDKRIQDKEDAKKELVDSIDDPDKLGEIWSLDKKTKKWTKKETKLTRRENAEEAIDLKDDMIDAIKSGDENAQKKALKAMMDSGLFSTNAPGVDTKKLYMGTVGPSARKKAGAASGKDTGRTDPVTGLPYLKFGNDNVFAKKIHELVEKHGDSIGKSFNLLGDKTGKKRMNPDNLFRVQAAKGEKAPTKKVEVKETKTGVTIGNFKMDGISKSFLEKEVKRLRKSGISDDDIKLYKKTVYLHNKKVQNFRDMANAKKEEDRNLQVFEINDEAGNPLDPSDDGDRKKMPLQITKMLNERYTQLLGKDFRKNSPAVGAAMDSLETAAGEFANGKDKDGSKFRKAQGLFFEAIDTDPETRPSVSDVAEILALAEDLSRGRYAVLPSKSNFAVGDVLSASMRAANIGGKTAEEISDSLKILLVTAKGLTSIKYAEGGSSQSSNKIAGTEYKSYGEYSGEDIKKDLMDLSTTSYDELWGFDKTSDAKKRTDEIQKKYDVTDCPKEPFTGKNKDSEAHKAGYLYADCSPAAVKKREEAWEKRAKGAKGIKNIEDCPELNTAIPKADENGTPYSKEERLDKAREKMVETYKEQERAGRTLQIVNNRQMDSQTWTNRVYEVLSDAAAKKKNEKWKDGDSKFNKKETNGVNVLGGMNFTENPGYDGPCGKPINKMASKITTVKK